MNDEKRIAILTSGELENFVVINNGEWDDLKWRHFKAFIEQKFGALNTDQLGLLLQAEKRLYHSNPSQYVAKANTLNSNTKGRQFENMVAEVLHKLERDFPALVRVSVQPRFTGQGRSHRADFDLQYDLGGLSHHHLIECQNRNKSSQEIADKIYAVRGVTDRNRYIFVYNNAEALSDSLMKRFSEMGVLTFSFEKFKSEFVSQLGADLAIHKIGLAAMKKFSIFDNIKSDFGEISWNRASEFNPRRQSPPDRGMIS